MQILLKKQNIQVLHITEKITKYLVSYINLCKLYANLFKNHKQCYSHQNLFEALLYKLEPKIAYNNICSPHFR